MSDYLVFLEVKGQATQDERGYEKRETMLSIQARVTPELAHRIAAEVNKLLAVDALGYE